MKNQKFVKIGQPRDPARIAELLKLIENYWQRPENTDLRLCQLLSALVNLHIRKTDDLFYIEDSELFEALTKIVKQNLSN